MRISGTARGRFVVRVQLSEPQPGYPAWSNYEGGRFSCQAIWTATGCGWGAAQVNRIVDEYQNLWTVDSTPAIGSIGQMLRSSNEYIYVRGGGVYTFITNDVVGDVTLHTSEYTEKEERIAPVSEVQEAVSLQRQADRLIGELTDWASDSLISPRKRAR